MTLINIKKSITFNQNLRKKYDNILLYLHKPIYRENNHLSVKACMIFFCWRHFVLLFNHPFMKLSIKVTISYFLYSVIIYQWRKRPTHCFITVFLFSLLSHRREPVLFENALISKSYYSFVVIVDFSRILMTDSLVHTQTKR